MNMDPPDPSTSTGRWGAEPLAERSAPVDKARRGRRWWLIGTVSAILVLSGAFYLVRRSIIHSLSESCREALRAEDWEQVERLAGRWRWWDRGKAAPLIYLAEAANRTERYERAVELLDQLPNEDPMTPPALLERAEILFGPLNRAIEGAETLERAIKLDPESVEARRRLIYFYAYTLQRRKMVDLAYDTIRHNCDLPETIVYILLQDSLSFSNAYKENTRWLRGDPDKELFLVARALHRIRSSGVDDTEDPKEGPRDKDGTPFHRKVVAEYFAKFPQNLELMAYYLQLSSTSGDVDEVARLLSRAPPEAENDNRFWRYKGWLHAAQGELRQAKESYERALLLNGYDYVSRHQLAGVERRFKRLEQVKALEELAIEGKAVQRELRQLEDVANVPEGLLKRMALYAEKCGDDVVASQLNYRIGQWSEEWSGMRAEPAVSVDD